jgi:hypothetical protein
MGLMVLEATGFRADSGLFIPLSQVTQMSGLAVPLVLVVIRLWMVLGQGTVPWAGRAPAWTQSLLNSPSSRSTDSLSGPFVLIPHGYPDYHTYLASLLMAVS